MRVNTQHTPFTEEMSLRKRGDRGGFEGFIDLGEMQTFLLGDPSDSDPGYEVTNLIHKISKEKAAHNIGL